MTDQFRERSSNTSSWDQDGCFEYHKPYELEKVGDNFLMDFSVFAHRFFKENLWKFISQMGNALGVYESSYVIKKAKS